MTKKNVNWPQNVIKRGGENTKHNFNESSKLWKVVECTCCYHRRLMLDISQHVACCLINFHQNYFIIVKNYHETSSPNLSSLFLSCPFNICQPQTASMISLKESFFVISWVLLCWCFHSHENFVFRDILSLILTFSKIRKHIWKFFSKIADSIEIAKSKWDS